MRSDVRRSRGRTGASRRHACFAILGAAALGLGIYWVTQPTTVAIQNRTFHESQAYNDGMARDLSDLQMAYMRADDAGKSTIRATVQQRFAGYDARRLPPNLQMFLTEMQ
jgi:uncharacterized protein HemX